MNENRSTISIVRCTDYNTNKVERSVRHAINLLGGIEKFVKRGERVLIKPNLLSARRPEEAVCTHPEVVRAVVRILKEVGASITIGDSPGGFLKNIEEVYRVSGISSVAREEKVNLVKFAFSKKVEGFPISVRVLGADKIISLPKFKTHEITGITGAVKNMYGSIVGLFKTKCHADAPTEKQLAKVIAKVFSLTKPDLSIVDGIVSMEGEGPSAGDPCRTEFIMAGCDAVAIDTMLAVLIGAKPLSFAVTSECGNMGLGQTDPDKIDILGENFSGFIKRDFKQARGRIILRFLPPLLMGMVAQQLKFWPEIDPELCKKCNMCKLSCPVHAIDVRKKIYYVDKGKCIRCMCCREVCPYKAIHVRKNWLARALWE